MSWIKWSVKWKTHANRAMPSTSQTRGNVVGYPASISLGHWWWDVGLHTVGLSLNARRHCRYRDRTSFCSPDNLTMLLQNHYAGYELLFEIVGVVVVSSLYRWVGRNKDRASTNCHRSKDSFVHANDCKLKIMTRHVKGACRRLIFANQYWVMNWNTSQIYVIGDQCNTEPIVLLSTYRCYQITSPVYFSVP